MYGIPITRLCLCLGIPEVLREVVNFSFISVAAIKYLNKSNVGINGLFQLIILGYSTL